MPWSASAVSPIAAVLCAALLHDVLEDTETKHSSCVDRFGREIADVVLDVSDDAASTSVRRRVQIGFAPSLSGRAKLVKLADHAVPVCAASPPARRPTGRRHASAADAEWAEQMLDGPARHQSRPGSRRRCGADGAALSRADDP